MDPRPGLRRLGARDHLQKTLKARRAARWPGLVHEMQTARRAGQSHRQTIQSLPGIAPGSLSAVRTHRQPRPRPPDSHPKIRRIWGGAGGGVMINRQNWLDTRAYLHYIEQGKDPATVKRARAYLRHLLEWADEASLTQARAIDPAFPTYLVTARDDGKPGPLSRSTIVRGLSAARLFFSWARAEWPGRYKSITESWINLLQPGRDLRLQNDLRIHEFYTLDEVRSLATVSVETLRERRAQAGACLLYLSGMRADALASLPIACVDLVNGQILQLPLMGVRTKNRKSA
ncbi:MAG: hypothetical protein EHM81_14215, partial [Chloroflexi bacterium]